MNERLSKAARVTKAICLVLSCAYILLWIGLAYLRLVYPYEVEWMEGAMMDHAVRIIAGKPIYTAPTIDFVAWLYPPFYYYVVAGVMKLIGIGWFAGRLVSIVSTILTAILLGLITKRITASSLLAFFTLALYIATYYATGFYFDIVRNDAFFTLLLVLTAFCALRIRGTTGVIITAVMLLLAFFTKQQAVFFLLPLILWYWLKSWKSGIAFISISISIGILALILLNSQTHGWLIYYLFKIPNAKRADFSWIRMLDVFPGYVFSMFTICSLALFTLIMMCRESARAFWGSAIGLLVMMALAALIVGAVSLGNEGGYANVMMPFAAFVVPMLPIAMYEIPMFKPEFGRFVYLALLIQLLSFYYNPLSKKMLIASKNQKRGGDEFMRALSQIQGEVFIPYHGFIAWQAGKATHAHVLAMMDVLRMHDTTAARLQSDLDSAYARHRFAAVILDESTVFSRDSVEHYTYSRRMIAEPNIYLTRVASEVTRPEYLFIPR